MGESCEKKRLVALSYLANYQRASQKEFTRNFSWNITAKWNVCLAVCLFSVLRSSTIYLPFKVTQRPSVRPSTIYLSFKVTQRDSTIIEYAAPFFEKVLFLHMSRHFALLIRQTANVFVFLFWLQKKPRKRKTMSAHKSKYPFLYKNRIILKYAEKSSPKSKNNQYCQTWTDIFISIWMQWSWIKVLCGNYRNTSVAY